MINKKAIEYAPRIFMDKKEPFPIKKVGFTEYHVDGCRSSFFNRSFDFANFRGAVSVLEYAYYLDYDIQHLYDLEHIWVYLDKDGEVVGAEGSYHGRFLNAMNRTFGKEKVQRDKRITMYSQPGKHAMLSDPRLMYLYSELFSSCDRLAGIHGLDAPERFVGSIELDSSENQKVIDYIRENYSFVPSMEFEEVQIPEEDYMSWEELAELIPGYIREQLNKILYMQNQIAELEKTIEKLHNRMFGEKISVDKCLCGDPIRYKKVPYGHRSDLFGDCRSWDEFENGGLWGEPDRHYLFRLKLQIPESFCGKEVSFFMSTGADDIWNTDNPQMLIYIDGVRRCGMDMNHNRVCIYEKSDWEKGKDRVVDIAIYAYSNLSENGNYLNMEIDAKDEAAMLLYFDMLVPFEAAKIFFDTQDEEKAVDILNKLNKAAEVAQNGDGKDTELVAASDYLRENLYGKGDFPITVASVGHTHIDVAWKWQLRQTVEKVVRSYSTVMELMKRYPEYLFMASTPQMYEFCREEEPELFEEIKKRVLEGRFEVEGAMWLEADCNLTSGESLVRQILYGKRYMKDTFGVDSNVLWLPDVFGYSAAMPQILKKSGIRAFVTTKLGWNDTNRMPHDLFWWEGIDGSDVVTYLISTCDYIKADEAMRNNGRLEYTYNGRQNSSQIMGTYRAFREKQVTDTVLTCYGYGDGGGGPTWEMLEMDRRLRLGVPGLPVTKQETVTEFMDELMERVKTSSDMPKWIGELYLEYHRGTYTSIGWNKQYNRKLEHLLREAEVLCACAVAFVGKEYPKESIDNVWKTVMLNQFHDILPGSSIEEVYNDSWEQYESAIATITGVIKGAVDALEGAGEILDAGNNICVNRHNDDLQEHAISYEKTESSEIRISTPFYNVVFDKNAEIISLFDKQIGKELRNEADTPLNRLIAFEDKPKDYDCWNIDSNFEDVSWNIDTAESVSVQTYDASGLETKGDQKGNENITKLVIHVERKFRDSKINQDIIFYNNSKRIDFRTNLDWHEHQILVKAAFPVDIDSDEITCDIQYGSLKRSLKRKTSWEKAKFECCAHKWIDISDKDGRHGVALLNDCKYGYDAKDKLMRLTLLKSGIFPNPNADQGVHVFTYSLFPHLGDYREGRVIENARELNFESHYYIPEKENTIALKDMLGIENSVIDLAGHNGIFIEAIKCSEDGKGLIVRLYEGYGENHKVTAKVFENSDILPKAVCECDLLENPIAGDTNIKYEPETKEISFEMKPFEIVTILISL